MTLYLDGTNGISGVDGSSSTPALQGTDSNTGISFPAADTVAINTGGTERSRVDSSGRLLVGTSSEISAVTPSIQVARSTGGFFAIANSDSISAADNMLGQIAFFGKQAGGYGFGAAITATSDAGWSSLSDVPTRLVFSTTADGASSPTERMRIDRNGNFGNCLGIYNNTTAAPANMFVGAAGDLGRSTSSGKYKTDVETVELGYSENLLGCRPVWYRSLCEKDNPNWGYWGFIAEEVAEIDPRLVYWKTTKPVVQENGSIEHVSCDPEPEGVAYDRFVPHLLNLIKRQKEQIEAMEARLTALEQS